MWIAYAFGAAFFGGLTAILAKIGIGDVPSHLATAIRTSVVLVMAWGVVGFVGSASQLPVISGRTWLFLILSGLATGASWLCYFKALQLGRVNAVAAIDRTSVVLTVLFAMIFLGETTFLAAKVVGIALVGAGTYLIVERPSRSDSRPASPPRSTPKSWIFFAAASAIFAALTAILGKVGIEGVESNLGTAIRTCVVLVMAWSMAAISKQLPQIRDISRYNLRFLLLSGIATGASWLCFYRALQGGPASVVVPIDKLSIVITVMFASLWLGEKLTRRGGVGLILLVSGTLAMTLTT